jgi:hypothetical protein
MDRADFRVFLVFLGISALLWLLATLSERYDARAAFRLNLVNCPDTLGIYVEDPPVLYARLRTSGFRFLTGAYGRKGLDIDLSRVAQNNNRYYLLRSQMGNIVNRKLPQEVELISLERDTFYLPIYFKHQKEIPVRSNLTYQLEQNYRLEDKLELAPATIIAEGPEGELAGLEDIYTEPLELGKVSEDINRIVTVNRPEELMNVSLSATTIRVHGKVRRFSERVFDIPVTIENAPEGYHLRLIPREVKLLCQAEQDRLNTLDESDFSVIAAMPSNEVETSSTQKKLPLTVGKVPDSVYSVRLLEKEVAYLLEPIK